MASKFRRRKYLACITVSVTIFGTFGKVPFRAHSKYTCVIIILYCLYRYPCTVLTLIILIFRSGEGMWFSFYTAILIVCYTSLAGYT